MSSHSPDPGELDLRADAGRLADKAGAPVSPVQAEALLHSLRTTLREKKLTSPQMERCLGDIARLSLEEVKHFGEIQQCFHSLLSANIPVRCEKPSLNGPEAAALVCLLETTLNDHGLADNSPAKLIVEYVYVHVLHLMAEPDHGPATALLFRHLERLLTTRRGLISPANMVSLLRLSRSFADRLTAKALGRIENLFVQLSAGLKGARGEAWEKSDAFMWCLDLWARAPGTGGWLCVAARCAAARGEWPDQYRMPAALVARVALAGASTPDLDSLIWKAVASLDADSKSAGGDSAAARRFRGWVADRLSVLRPELARWKAEIFAQTFDF